MRKYLNLILVILFLSISFTISFAQEGSVWQTTGNVAVRSEPSQNANIVSYLKQGIVVEGIEQKDNWVKVKSQKGTTGWVHKSMLMPVSEDLKSACEGVHGFSAVCPAKKDNKVPQGQIVETENKSAQVSGGANPNVLINQPVVPPSQPKIPNISQNMALPNEKMLKNQAVPGSPNSNASNENPNVITADKIISGKTDSFDVNTDYGEKISGNSYIVEPERTSIIKMSSSDINRIVCPIDIKDVVYSEEKGVIVKISGKNAFVKFLIKRIGGKEIYPNTPADIFVVCGDKVYSIIAMPERIPSVNVYLEDKSQKIKEIVEKNKLIPYERKIINYVKDFVTGKVPPEAAYSVVNREYKIYQDLEIKEKANYFIEGEGLTIRVFHITGKGNIEIREKDFLRKEITQNPLAISLDRLKLAQGEKAILIIIEKSRG